MAKAQKLEIPTVYRLPEEYQTKIGHIIIAFSYMEYLLSRVIYDLLGVGQKEGRLAVREPRATDRLDVIADLLELKEFIPQVNMAELKKKLEKVQNSRNNIAHCVWLQHPNSHQVFLRVTKGNWVPSREIGKVKKITHPEAVPYGVSELEKVSSDIDEVTHIVLELAREVTYKFPALKEKNLARDRASKSKA